MVKKYTWVELTAPAGPHKAGAVIGFSEPDARAYIAAGRAVARPDAQRALDLAEARDLSLLKDEIEAEVRAAVRELLARPV